MLTDEPPEQHEAALREFLGEHPEHLPGVRRMDLPGRPGELMVDTETLLTFSDWAIRKGYVRDPEQARRFRERVATGGIGPS